MSGREVDPPDITENTACIIKIKKLRKVGGTCICIGKWEMRLAEKSTIRTTFHDTYIHQRVLVHDCTNDRYDRVGGCKSIAGHQPGPENIGVKIIGDDPDIYAIGMTDRSNPL